MLGTTQLPSFDACYPAAYHAGYRAAFRLLGDREDAFDVAQEACARLYREWERLAGSVNPAGWVVRAATNLAIDRWRRRRTASRLHLVPAPPADPKLAERVDLHRALDALPTRQREVVLLRYIADLSQDDVAALLGCSPGSVKTHGSRGLAALRAALDIEDNR